MKWFLLIASFAVILSGCHGRNDDKYHCRERIEIMGISGGDYLCRTKDGAKKVGVSWRKYKERQAQKASEELDKLLEGRTTAEPPQHTESKKD